MARPVYGASCVLVCVVAFGPILVAAVSPRIIRSDPDAVAIDVSSSGHFHDARNVGTSSHQDRAWTLEQAHEKVVSRFSGTPPKKKVFSEVGHLLVPVQTGHAAQASEAHAILSEQSEHAVMKDTSRGSPTTQVLLVSVVMMAVLVAGWASHWFSSQGHLESYHQGSLKLILLCISFGACSWGMNVLNKTLVQALDAPCLVTGAQMLMTVLSTLLTTRGKLSGSSSEVLKWLIVPFLFVSMLVTSLSTYKYLTLSMLMVIRNMAPVVTLPLENLVMPPERRPAVNAQVCFALGLSLLGTFLYCQKIEVSRSGLAFALLNMGLAISDRVVQRRLLTTECSNLGLETCVVLNNGVGLIPVLFLAYYMGEFAQAKPQDWLSAINLAVLALSGMVGSGICYFALAVQREITATSFMILQNVVRMAVVVVGVVMFFDPIGGPWQQLGLTLSFAGALFYGKFQMDAKPR